MAVCDVVCNPSMVGYQEVLSDPACYQQLVCLTYPLIGSYGITKEDFEARTLLAGGVIVGEYNESMANYRAVQTLGEAMEEHKIPGITGVDTRCIARMVAEKGSIKAILCDADLPEQEAMAMVRQQKVAQNPLEGVSCRKRWHARAANAAYHVVAIDCGLKKSLVQQLLLQRCNVTVVPYNASAEEIQGLFPDGVLVAGGPGTPMDAPETIAVLRQLAGNVPLFGFGLGHLLVAQACGCTLEKTEKPRQGGCTPVRNTKTGSIITVPKNQKYTVCPQGLAELGFAVTFENVLDKTIEGLENKDRRVFTLQWNPEGAPGPQDSLPLFEKLTQIMADDTKGGRSNA